MQVSFEKRADSISNSLGHQKVDGPNSQPNDTNSAKARLKQENIDLQHQVHELVLANAALAKAKSQLQTQNEDLKTVLDDDRLQRQNLQVQLSQLHAEYDNLSHRYDEEINDLYRRNDDLQLMNEKLSDEVEALRDAEAKLAAAQAALAQLRTEMETKLREKDEEIENIRENNTHEIEKVITTCHIQNNRLYDNVRELKAVLKNANKSNAECLEQIRALQQRVEELEVLLEEARLNNTIEEDLRTRLDAAERARKNVENELAETSARLSAVQIQVTTLMNVERRLETDIIVMESHLEEAFKTQRAAEERADRLCNERMRLHDELILEQENYKNAESLRKQLEIEIHELKIRLEEAEANAAKSVRSIVARLRTRVPSLY